jgi:epsilon-lactone hydrolase
MHLRSRLLQFLAPIIFLVTISPASLTQTQPPKEAVVIQPNGTVEVPALQVPPSSFLSDQAKSYVAEHLIQMQQAGFPGLMKSMLERDKVLFPLKKTDEQLGGVHVVSYLPHDGVSPRNKHRVLINLHGGGFSGCWPGCADLESIPISSLMKIQVITVDYREGPANKFPAASEDVASVYREVLKTHRAANVGIYGCSAGGMLTAMSLAWFQTHNLPTPGAAGIYCASAGGFGGDASYTAYPLGEAKLPPATPSTRTPLTYLSETDPKDPLVAPINSKEIAAKFPPTLIITATRDFAMSSAIHTDVVLTGFGVHTELHVWDGLFHGFFYDPDVPESKEAFDIMTKFFDSQLGTR